MRGAIYIPVNGFTLFHSPDNGNEWEWEPPEAPWYDIITTLQSWFNIIAIWNILRYAEYFSNLYIIIVVLFFQLEII